MCGGNGRRTNVKFDLDDQVVHLMQPEEGEAQTVDESNYSNTDRRRALSAMSSLEYASQLLKLEQSEKVKGWLSSFTALDPRLQILHFFNDLALEGVDRYESKDGDDVRNATSCPKLLRGFAKSGMFTVWRPTSADAIKTMITGEGTGKGLDIKGKSALRGPHSGFVPFLQISNNDHKDAIGPTLHLHNRVRVFYPTMESRDGAFASLARLSKSMLGEALTKTKNTFKIPTTTTTTTSSSLSSSSHGNRGGGGGGRGTFFVTDMVTDLSDMVTDLMPELVTDLMADPKVYKIDDYAEEHEIYGLDLPERLLWEGYVMSTDITRPEGSKYDTGRQSMPAFQQMNIDTLRKWDGGNKGSSASRHPDEVDPRPVLWHAGCCDSGEEDCDPLCPQGLLMAYEEEGRVTPVVSDFDCFLLGTRGVKYEKPFRKEELSMLSWCIEEISGILSTPKEGVSWTSRWLEVKKKLVQSQDASGCNNKEMPKFGYADPRSYSIIKGVVKRLRGNGAVRHGPECFNYAFPQELDDKFLVISDTFWGVPWRYVGPDELIDILSDKIDEGFTFPLNPKWLLCDPGWKRLYDKLMASQMPNVQDSMNIWYPTEIRNRINEISTNFPQGFVVSNNGSSKSLEGISTDDRATLAEFELAQFRENYRSNWKMRCQDFVKNKKTKMMNKATKMKNRAPKVRAPKVRTPKVRSFITLSSRDENNNWNAKEYQAALAAEQ